MAHTLQEIPTILLTSGATCFQFLLPVECRSHYDEVISSGSWPSSQDGQRACLASLRNVCDDVSEKLSRVIVMAVMRAGPVSQTWTPYQGMLFVAYPLVYLVCRVLI